ncbi:hypothetical protein BVC80_1831g34 [Macleaya cordata]|uniref:Uncharacterized protein n=1 Tax=Macleaya cordata TaxID=56857 RepID=A0A200R708_MACCD|nr:hypothetical protein BVC80_1831g34 [Macleaya cordata]
MNFGFLNNLPGFGYLSNMDLLSTTKSIGAITETYKQRVFFDKIWGWSLLSFVPWVFNSRDNFQIPLTVNRKLTQNKSTHGAKEPCGGCSVPLFRPYVAKVPYHKGARGFLSQLFPRYGHYCGPNWSSGKDNGSLLWDRRPIDWLDFCCYCHDIGYDTHDQAQLLKADLAFLECLERPGMNNKGDIHVARLYRTMCITGLRNILIPYRRHLVRLQEGRSVIEWLGGLSRRNNTYRET